MKKILALFVLMLPVLSFAEQENEVYVEYSIYFEKEGFGYLKLSDGVTWQVYPLELRKQTWGEWWNSVDVPKPDERFLTKMTEWGENTPVLLHVFDLKDFAISLEDIVNKDVVRRCSHLIENKGWGRYLFAKRVDFAKVMQDLKDSFFEKGRDVGYKQGYQSGYSSGYSWGHSAGVREGREQLKEELQKAAEEKPKPAQNRKS